MVNHWLVLIGLSLAPLMAACSATSPVPQAPTSAPVVQLPFPALSPPATFAPSLTSPPSPTATTSPTAARTPTTPPSPTSTRMPTLAASPAVTAAPRSLPLSCEVLPTGSFRGIWQSDAILQAALGCPTSNHPRITPTAWAVMTSYQAFERGSMIWSDHIGWYAQPIIFALYEGGLYESFQDTFDPSVDPINSGATPPPGLLEPNLGFGKLWRQQPGVRDRLGWSKSPEMSGTGRFEMLEGGYIVWISQTNRTYAFVFNPKGNTVRVFDVPFTEQ